MSKPEMTIEQRLARIEGIFEQLLAIVSQSGFGVNPDCESVPAQPAKADEKPAVADPNPDSPPCTDDLMNLIRQCQTKTELENVGDDIRALRFRNLITDDDQKKLRELYQTRARALAGKGK